MLRRERWVAALLLGLHLALILWGAARNSVTFDENFHLPSGVLIAAQGNYMISPVNPPLIKALCGAAALAAGARLPDAAAIATGDQWQVGESFMRVNADRYQRVFMAARVVVAMISLALGLLVWSFARRLYGRGGGLLALAFYAFMPEALAHGGVVTLDVATALVLLGAIYAWWVCTRTGRWSAWGVAALAVGAAVLTRFLSVVLAPILVGLTLWLQLRGRLRRPARAWVGLALLPLTTLVMLAAAYRGQVSLRPLSEFSFVSHTFKGLQRQAPALRLPMPDAMIDGLDWQSNEGQAGQTPTYLLGRIRTGPVWEYFPLALLFKWPLGFLLALAVRAVAAGRGVRRRHEVFLAAPAALLLGIAVFVIQLNIGIRYLFPLVPLACLWLGGLARGVRLPLPTGAARTWWWVGVTLAGLQAAEATAAAPWHLSFFNVAAGGPGGGYRLVNDSNVDWGQGLIALREELARRGIKRVHLAYHGTTDPTIYGIDSVPYLGGDPGPESDWIAISSYYCVGQWQRMTTSQGRTRSIRIDFSGLWRREPDAVVAGCIYLYRLRVSAPANANPSPFGRARR